MDSQFTDNDCVVSPKSPKIEKKVPIDTKEDKKSKDTKSELPKDNVVNQIVDKYKKVELQADSKTSVRPNESEIKDVQNAPPVKKDKNPTPKTKRLVSVSEPLDKAMDQLSLGLEDGDTCVGMTSPDSQGM